MKKWEKMKEYICFFIAHLYLCGYVRGHKESVYKYISIINIYVRSFFCIFLSWSPGGSYLDMKSNS